MNRRGHAHTDTCACGKNNTAFAHGAIEAELRGGAHRVLEPMDCAQVEGIRQRVARDLTRADMNPWQRLTSRLQGRGNEYTPESYERAWVSRSDLNPAQRDYWAGQERHAQGARTATQTANWATRGYSDVQAAQAAAQAHAQAQAEAARADSAAADGAGA